MPAHGLLFHAVRGSTSCRHGAKGNIQMEKVKSTIQETLAPEYTHSHTWTYTGIVHLSWTYSVPLPVAAILEDKAAPFLCV